jgi:CO/xanthine dehydrogenase Mo-binding subunit
MAVDSGDVDARLAQAARVVRATYRFPYQMHGSLGTSCAVADVRSDAATIWSATQAVFPMRSALAQLLEMAPANVRVVFRTGSGCYGINGADTVSYDAALLSRAVGRPVRVQLSRDAEMAWENFGLAYVIDQRAGIDESGTIVAWDYEGWNPTRGGRPGANTPGNVVTGHLAGFQPAPFAARTPAPRPAVYANNSNVVPSYVAGCVGSACGGTGVVRSERVLSHVVESPFFTGPLRSPSRLQNTFAHESFMDEIAAAAGADPVAFRLRHLRDPRLRAVISAAAAAARWDARPSPRRGVARQGTAAGRGIASVLYEGDNGYCAAVADVRVDQETGDIAITRCVVALDCGPVSNPDGVRNQIEGGIVQGISRALREEVTWDARRITSVDWRTYRPWYLGDPVPVIETVLIPQEAVPATGAGETAVTVAAAAIGNAVFDATGARLRQIPFTPARVKAALASR